MPRVRPVNTPRQSSKPSRRKNKPNQFHSQRRIVTALCYDMVGSTNLLHLLDIEDYQELISAFQDAAGRAITTNSGIVQLEAGDGGVALFPIELGAKDAASLAIRAGLKIIDACKHVGNTFGQKDLHVRVGIATSVALIQETTAENWTQEPVTGAALSMATRLEALAAPDSVLVSEQTRNLAGRSHAFVFQGTKPLKGFTEPEKVWQALGHKKEVNRFYAFGRLGGPFVGRAHELHVVETLWKNALAGRGELLWLEGDAGIGKSRLVREIRRLTRDQRSRLIFFQCLPGGERSTLHPLLHSFPEGLSNRGGETRFSASDVAALFARQGIHRPEIADVFSYLLGAAGRNEDFAANDPAVVREKARRALSMALEAMCEGGPIVLIVEDIHWIDPTSRDLLVETARVLQQFPALLIVTSRPKTAIDWPESAEPTRIPMAPLDADETRAAIEARWPEHRMAILPDLLEVTGRISGGIPLFIEEICKWASEDAGTDAMKLSGTAAATHVSAFEGILDARLYQFGSARELARAAAVAGSRFTPALLHALLPDFGKKALATAADTLCDTGILTRLRSHGTVTYSFRHALIQETIYNALLRKQRQSLHRRLFTAVSQDRQLAPWIGTDGLAVHAERAGLLENAVALYIEVGKEDANRSAMVEARHHLEHALGLCERLGGGEQTDVLQLSAFLALGPVLTGMVGQSSPQARKLYEDGVAIARRQPRETQPRWFPIYWGWWLTGADFLVMHDRALQVQVMLSGVDDPEIRLQVKHCIWAIDFNLGRHKETQHAISTGLELYDSRKAETARTLFGGHDARVCGLGQLALSLWITGDTQHSDEALATMVRFADELSHVASKAHSLDTEAVSAFYREDYVRLADIARQMRDLASAHEMQSLYGMSLLFGGWADAHLRNLAAGHDVFREGLSLLRRLGAVVDLPIYLYMHAEMLGLAEKYETAIDVVTDAIKETKETGHSYWLSELYRCRAVLRIKADLRKDLAAEDFRTSVAIAERQGAVALLQRTRRSIQEFGIVVQL